MQFPDGMRVYRTQSGIRGGPHNTGSLVDGLISDRRAEAAREAAR